MGMGVGSFVSTSFISTYIQTETHCFHFINVVFYFLFKYRVILFESSIVDENSYLLTMSVSGQSENLFLMTSTLSVYYKYFSFILCPLFTGTGQL